MNADQSIADNVGGLLSQGAHSPLFFLNFFYLKYLFIFVLIFSFLFMMLGKSNNSIKMTRNSRRNYMLLWNDDKHEKMKGLLKKSTNIQNFEKYKPSDIENITLLNTLINAYISKMYDELSCINNLNILSSNSSIKPGECKNENEQDVLTPVKLDKTDSCASILVKRNSANSCQPERNSSKRRDIDSMSASNEVEQGSHID